MTSTYMESIWIQQLISTCHGEIRGCLGSRALTETFGNSSVKINIEISFFKNDSLESRTNMASDIVSDQRTKRIFDF